MDGTERKQSEEGYISVLQSRYSNQTGTVKFGVESDEFRIERGTKQGDPVSTALFNAVLELCMRRTKKRWRACGTKSTHCGFLVKSQEEVRGELDPTKNSKFLTNLRFADDFLIIAKTKEELSRMMNCLKRRVSKGRIGDAQRQDTGTHQWTPRKPRLTKARTQTV